MRVSLPQMSVKVVREILPASKVKIFKRSNPKEPQKKDDSPDYRENEMRIQMLSSSLYQQIFGSTEPPKLDATLMQK